MVNIGGSWIGKITYGKGYRKFENEVLTVQLKIIQEGDKIRGSSVDIQGYGKSREPATFVGTVDGNRVVIRKKYPSLHYAYDDGIIRIDKSIKGPPIILYGSYNEANQLISGNWRMTMTWYIFGFIPWKQTGYGTWEIKRRDT